MSNNYNKNRIIKNSATLYLRMMITMVLNLLTTRFVLQALGVENMGVYGVVGSIVSMFTVCINGLLSTTQRFITFEMGKLNGNVHNVFNTSTNLINLLSIALFFLLEIGGIWMLENNINIPQQSIDAAQWTLQFSILTCILNLNSTTYSALVIAHERMEVWALISILQVILSCVLAYNLSLFADNERLVYYAVFTFIIQIIVQTSYILYCKWHFPETKYQAKIDKDIVCDMAKYAGASTFSGVLQMLISQGIVLIINWTYGVTINAVYNIGIQVKNSVLSFGMNIFKSIAPQITKTYAAGEYDKHLKLVYSGSKMGIYMIMLILFPFCMYNHLIMELWLGSVPSYTSAFAIAFVFQSLFYAGFEPFRTAVLASGQVAKFFIYSELVHALVLPIGYFVGTHNAVNPIPLVFIIVLMELVYCSSMVWLGTRVSKLTIPDLLFNVLKPVTIVGILTFILTYLLRQILPTNILGLAIQIGVGSFILLLIIYLTGISSSERIIINNIIFKILKIHFINKNQRIQ